MMPAANFEPYVMYNGARSMRSSPKVIPMADHPLREPNQTRADCARKVKPIETGGMFMAVLAALLDEAKDRGTVHHVRPLHPRPTVR